MFVKHLDKIVSGRRRWRGSEGKSGPPKSRRGGGWSVGNSKQTEQGGEVMVVMIVTMVGYWS